MPTPLSATTISTFPATSCTVTVTVASGPACRSALSTRLPITTSSSRGATCTDAAVTARTSRSRPRCARRERRSATTSCAMRAALETPSASAAFPRSSEASSSISSTRRRMLSISTSVCATRASRSASDCGSAIVSDRPEDARQRRAQLVRDGGREQPARLAEVDRARRRRPCTATALRPLPLGCARRCVSNVRRSGLPRTSSWSSACPVATTLAYGVGQPRPDVDRRRAGRDAGEGLARRAVGPHHDAARVEDQDRHRRGLEDRLARGDRAVELVARHQPAELPCDRDGHLALVLVRAEQRQRLAPVAP